MGSEQGLQAGRVAEAAFGQSLGTCRCQHQLLSLVSVMETTVSSLLGWPVGILEPEPSSWTPYPTPSISTSPGTSSYLAPPTQITATAAFLTSVNRITLQGHTAVFTSASSTMCFIYLFDCTGS